MSVDYDLASISETDIAIVGMAARHGLAMGLDLPPTVWRPLVALPLARAHLATVDALAVRTLDELEQLAARPAPDALFGRAARAVAAFAATGAAAAGAVVAAGAGVATGGVTPC